MIVRTYLFVPTTLFVQHTTSNNRNTTQIVQKHPHHDPPRPLASRRSKFVGKYDRLTSCNCAWSPQHGNTFFLHETNLFFILFIFILQAPDQRAGRWQVYFFSEYLPFFLGRYVESTRTDPSYPLIFFLLMPPMSSSCFRMISDKGRAAPWSPCLLESRAGTLGR